MRSLWIVLVPLLAIGCGHSPAELAAMDDQTLAATAEHATNEQLCSVRRQPGVYDYRTEAAARRVMDARDLGDCTEAHQQCSSLGYQVGTPGYLDCRAERSREAAGYAQVAAQRQQSISNALQLVQRRWAPPQTYPSTTTCLPFGTGVTCQNY